MFKTQYLSKRKLVANVMYRYRKEFLTYVIPATQRDDKYSFNLFLRAIKGTSDSVDFQITFEAINNTGGLRTLYEDFFIDTKERAEECFSKLKVMLANMRDHYEYHRINSIHINKDLKNKLLPIKETYQKK